MEIIDVESFLNWGKLVKTWATGKSYFQNDSPPITIDKLPIPRTLDELKAQTLLVGAGVTIPANVVGLAIVQYTPYTLVIRLPPKARIEAMEKSLSEPGTTPYDLPDFYADFINRPLDVKERLEMHACRIGDYTMSMCG
ncbi:MAG: hypothetical protein WAO08_28980 [Hyphomicrobiaceae bacterium]